MHILAQGWSIEMKFKKNNNNKKKKYIYIYIYIFNLRKKIFFGFFLLVCTDDYFIRYHVYRLLV